MILNNIINNRFILFIIAIIALQLMNFNQVQSSAWISPYLSAASNFDFTTWMMQVDLSQMDEFARLSKAEQFTYNFPHSSTLVDYDHLSKGFMLIVIFAKTLFFFLGDLQAVQLLQGLVHITLSLIIANLLNKDYQKWLFLILYMLNPLVLYLVNFPYYYFWQFIPSVIFLIYFLSGRRFGNWVFLASLIFSFVYITRPTVLFFVLFFYGLYGFKEGWLKSILAIILFFVLTTIVPKYSFGPWHTAYIGIGAYDNKYNITISDNDGYDYFKLQTGKIYNSSTVLDKELKSEYYQVLKDKYLHIANESPSLLVKNAILNISQSYSLGYKTNNTFLNYTIAMIGIVFIVLLLYSKQYLLFFAIGAAGAGFTPYYPPIPAYMFGSYILLVTAFIFIIDFFLRKNE